MNQYTLSKWADLLLDTGKRNNLINFNSNTASSVEIIQPNFQSVFDAIKHRRTLEIYNPKSIFDEDDGSLKKEVNIPRQEYIRIHGFKLKGRQVLIYHPLYNPISSIKGLKKKAASVIEETGINILYMAFGFVNWKEKDNSEDIMSAPLLLVPISISNESAISPICINVIEDDILTNPTFVYKLQQEYGISLPEYENEEDDDVLHYLHKLEDIFLKLDWHIDYSCKIALFSFQKLNMHNDLKDNCDIIMESPNVRALSGESISQGNLSPISIEKSTNPLIELHNVVDADSSQIEAIEMAKQGKSFVLQGPPGTGKSQTITNIIAECLYDGKKVLFVSEKIAALNVVYDKLKKAKLSEFCLELHSHKANKKDFIQQLYDTLHLPKYELKEDALNELETLKNAQQQLDEYDHQLHLIHPEMNESVYQMHEEYNKYSHTPNSNYLIPDIASKDKEYLLKAEELLNHYVSFISTLGYDYHQSIFYGFQIQNTSQSSLSSLYRDFTQSRLYIEKIDQINDKILPEYGLKIRNLETLDTIESLILLIKDSQFIIPEDFEINTLNDNINLYQKFKGTLDLYNDRTQKLNEHFNKGIYELNGRELKEKFEDKYSNWFKRFCSRKYKKDRKEIRVHLLNPDEKLNFKSLKNYVEILFDSQSARNQFDKLVANPAFTITEGFRGLQSTFDDALEELTKLKTLLSSLGFETNLSTLTYQQFVTEKGEFKAIGEELEQLHLTYGESFQRINDAFDTNLFNPRKHTLEQLKYHYQQMSDQIEKLPDWCHFLQDLTRMRELGVSSYLDTCLKEKVQKEHIVSMYHKQFYVQWMEHLIHLDPVLSSFYRLPHDEAVNVFQKEDKINFEINKSKIKSKLSFTRPDLSLVIPGSPTATVLREGEKKRKIKSIRTLLAEVPETIQNIKPCFLMSPLSVSTYLSPHMKFDVVIFDEASQIFPQDAIGAIYRGNQLIVVGDSMQMPPSNFFNTIRVSDIDDKDEDENLSDYESILDICSSIFPHKQLRWHYRSRNEQLIAFSNKNYYHNNLISFPSCQKDIREDVGVDYIYTAGTFDRKSKTNRLEAEKVVDLVFQHIKKHPAQSLGVVAFSIAQQSLIDRLIHKRRVLSPETESFFRSDVAEPFFVKNLETVQGDERDVIIFSTAYAKDSSGHFSLNFGPLNKEGGERRLNVAITRAKINIKLVTSMHESDIDLSRTGSLGIKLIKEYLDFAEHGQKALNLSAFDKEQEQHTSVENEIRDFLAQKGYKSDIKVGYSSFRVDIAIKHPKTDDYFFAIEMDGPSYHQCQNTRDRERLRQEVLENMGWNFYRIWTPDWFSNTAAEKERLLEYLTNTVNKTISFKTTNESKIIPIFEQETNVGFSFPRYKMSDVIDMYRSHDNDPYKTMKAIIEAEEPINKDWLIKRMLPLFQRDRINDAIRDTFQMYTYQLEEDNIFLIDDFFYCGETPEISMLRVPLGSNPRDLKHISIYEIAGALEKLIQVNKTVNKDSLFHAIVDLLNISRLTENVENRLAESLSLIQDEIDINDNVIRWID